MKVLVTGGSGFLGSALALYFMQAGYEVALLLRPTSKLRRLLGKEASFTIGRCESDSEIEEFVTRCTPDVIIHTACSYGRQCESLTMISDANLRLGLVVIQSVLEMKKPVTFINTGTVLEAGVSPYAISKLQFAQWGAFLASQSAGKLQFINVRLQHMYGPGDDSSKFTTYVLQTLKNNESIIKLTAGDQKRDFIYIADVVSAYSTLVEKRGTLGNEIEIDLGSGAAPAVREFVEIAHKLTQSKTELQFGALPYRPNEPMHLQADISQLSALGWQPKFSLESGITKTLELGCSE